MDAQTRQVIVTVLTAFLNRPPSEDEIMNAQTDIITMMKVDKILNQQTP